MIIETVISLATLNSCEAKLATKESEFQERDPIPLIIKRTDDSTSYSYGKMNPYQSFFNKTTAYFAVVDRFKLNK